ncbi:MAG: MFS transporter [Alphaproteobacteria bacterium]|nr:MFS transporter [Alphaproteobacteria bacterium]
MSIAPETRIVATLSACQALWMTGQNIMISVAGLVGYSLAEDKALATLGVTTMIAGAAAMTVPAAFLMKRFGRRSGFVMGALIGASGAGLAALAIQLANFWLFVQGTFGMGLFNAYANFYRFAAADAVPPPRKARAISWVLTGGVFAALVGPSIATGTKDLFEPLTFLGSYLAIAGLQAGAALLSATLSIPAPSAAESKEPGRPLAEIARQPAFVVALLGGVVSYGVMNMLMTATPLAMVACALPFGDAATVIQWHILGMFVPSFFTGALIARIGVLTVMQIGVGLLLAAVGIALAGVDLMNFWISLTVVGVGWNFTFIGATTLLTEVYRPAERAKVQAANDFAVFGAMAAASFLSGALLHAYGWSFVNWAALPLLVAVGGGVVWLARTRHGTVT